MLVTNLPQVLEFVKDWNVKWTQGWFKHKFTLSLLASRMLFLKVQTFNVIIILLDATN
jgi:hypothetical protein